MQLLSPELKTILLMSGAAAFIFALWSGIDLLMRKYSGWKAITERFPMTDTHALGDFYKEQSVVAGKLSCEGGLKIRLAQEGVCLYPSFARRMPCLIPWSSVRSVSSRDSRIYLVVNYEQPLKFFLPADALPVVKAKLSAELFQQTVSPSAVKHPLSTVRKP